MKRVARGRTAGSELLSFVDILISSIRNLPVPVLPMIVIPTFPGGHQLLQSYQMSDKMCTIFERKKADTAFVRRR